MVRGLALTGVAVACGVLWRRLRPDAQDSRRPTPPDAGEPRAVRWLASSRPPPPATAAGRVAAYAWASPLTAVGVVLGALSRSRPRVHDGVLLFADARGVGGRMLHWRGFAATALGHAIIATGRPGERLLQHELVHVRQAERWGPLFVPLYLAGLLRYGYRANPLERAAYADDGLGTPVTPA